MTGVQTCALPISFSIARLLGHGILYRWFGEKLKVGLLESQSVLTAIIFVSRLLPLISFDIVSYAVGLTEVIGFFCTHPGAKHPERCDEAESRGAA